MQGGKDIRHLARHGSEDDVVLGATGLSASGQGSATEAWVDGHIHAFAFFGAVPQSIVHDNDRCLVARILPDGTRKRASLFSGFLSHYLIRDRYGRPGRGNE